MEIKAAEQAAQRFLRTGNHQDQDCSELALACDRLVQQAARSSYKRALVLAQRFVARAKECHGPLELMAYRSLARITHMSGEHAEALIAYKRARQLTGRDRLARARIDRALIDVYMYLGKFKDSERAAHFAIAAFRSLKSPNDLAQARVNYGNLLHRQDRHREAEKIYRDAVAFFETTENEVALARCYYNLANSLVQLFHIDEAEQLYEKARAMWEKADCELDACDARYGLAWLYMLTGRLHTALVELRACEQIYHKAGDRRGEALCVLDRAEVSLHLGLSADALESARNAEKRFDKLKLRYEMSKAALFHSQSALALGLRAEALRSIQIARKGFVRDKNEGFLGVSLLTETDALASSNGDSGRHLHQARRHFAKSQLPLWQAVSDLKKAAVTSRPESALKRLAANRAAHHVPHLYALWQVLQGDTDFRQGRLDEARRCWQRAADRLDTVRAQLPPVELRTTYNRNRISPHARLVSIELSRDPLQAAMWSERQKTAGMWQPIMGMSALSPERAKIETSLQTLASQFSALAHQVNAFGSERGRAAQSDNRVVARMRRQIREEFIRIENNAPPEQASSELLRAQMYLHSQSYPIVQFHLTDNDIIAFIHYRNRTNAQTFAGGRIRLISALQRWRFLLEAELLPGYPGQGERLQIEESLWEETAEWLWLPLGISPELSTVVIIPEGELANLPWEALRVNHVTLGSIHNFVLAPSIRHFAASKSQTVNSQAIEIFRGAGGNLPHVDAELKALQMIAGNRAHLHAPTKRGEWPSEGDAHVWHFSGHAMMNEENPFYSNLVLSDGPLFAVDFRMKQCRVNLATLAACRSGEQVAMPGEESTGLVRSLLEMGARNVIAGRWPVSDHTAAIWMKTFYQQFLVSTDILNAARAAAQNVKEMFPSAFHWAAFAVFGSGDIGGTDEIH